MLTKREMDIQLLHACIEEKWKPFANGRSYHEDFYMYGQNTGSSCTLCQVYFGKCFSCPLGYYIGINYCGFPEMERWTEALSGSAEETAAAKEVLAVLEAALENLKEGEEQ